MLKSSTQTLCLSANKGAQALKSLKCTYTMLECSMVSFP